MIFDTNLDVKNPNGAAPECAKDFKIEVRDELGWHVVGEVVGNYQRRCEIRFSPRKVLGCRLTITATNGDASARCYQVHLTR